MRRAADIITILAAVLVIAACDSAVNTPAPAPNGIAPTATVLVNVAVQLQPTVTNTPLPPTPTRPTTPSPLPPSPTSTPRLATPTPVISSDPATILAIYDNGGHTPTVDSVKQMQDEINWIAVHCSGSDTKVTDLALSTYKRLREQHLYSNTILSLLQNVGYTLANNYQARCWSSFENYGVSLGLAPATPGPEYVGDVDATPTAKGGTDTQMGNTGTDAQGSISPSALFDEAVTNWLNTNSYHVNASFASAQETIDMKGNFSTNAALYQLIKDKSLVFNVVSYNGQAYVNYSQNGNTIWSSVSPAFEGATLTPLITRIFDPNKLGLVTEKRIDVINDTAGSNDIHLAVSNAERFTNLTRNNTNLDVWITYDSTFGNIVDRVKFVDDLTGTSIDIIYSDYNISVQAPAAEAQATAIAEVGNAQAQQQAIATATHEAQQAIASATHEAMNHIYATATAIAPIQAARQYQLHGVSMVSPSDGWAVGDYGVTVHYDGKVWEIVGMPKYDSNFGPTLRSIYMVSANDGWAVGDGGTIIHFDGRRWSLVAVPFDDYRYSLPNINSVYMVSAGEGWAVGTSGIILHYTAGTWSKQDSSMTGEAVWDLKSVHMLSSGEGWAVGDEGTILHYVAGTWSKVDVQGGSSSLKSVYMVSNNEAWAMGYNMIVHYSNGLWTALEDPKGYSFIDILPESIYMTSPNDGWAVGMGGTLMHYADGKWANVKLTKEMATYIPDADLHSIYMLSPSEGWAVGSDMSGSGNGNTVFLHYKDGVWSKY